MDSARRVYHLTIAFGVTALVATLLAVGGALTAVKLTVPSSGALLDACQRVLPSDLGWTAFAVLAAITIGTVALLRLVRSVARQLGAARRCLTRLPLAGHRTIARTPVLVFESDRADAFCAGLLRPRIYASRAAVEILDPAELDAVIAHERHHRDRRDPLRLFLIRSLAEALFFMPALRRLAERYATLAELAADEAAMRESDAGALASALLSFGSTPDPEVAVGIGPDRADHLLGKRLRRWELPASLVAAAVVALAALLALGVIATSSGASLHPAMLAAESCMLLMTALALGAAMLLLWRLSPRGRGRLAG